MAASAVEMEERQARGANRGGRTLAGLPLSYWAIGAGVIGGAVLYMRSKGALVGAGAKPAATASQSTALVPTGGYGSINAPPVGSVDYGAILAQIANTPQTGTGAGTGMGGAVTGVLTNPPQVAYGAKDPAHPISGLKDELNGLHRWISAPGGASIPGGPVGYGAAGGENTPNVVSTASGQTYSELPGGSAFESALASGTQLFWQPQPLTFLPYPTKNGRRAAGAPAYGTPVFVKEGF